MVHQWLNVCSLQPMLSLCLVTLGVHVQQGLRYLVFVCGVCVCACASVSVCLSVSAIQPLRATG